MEKERVLAIFESKILREIYGPVKENDLWSIRRKYEIEAVIKGQNIVRFIQCQRKRWLVHIETMQDPSNPKNLLYGMLHATERRGRPKMRWLVEVSADPRKMELKDWKNRATDREGCRGIVNEAKVHPEL